MAESAADLKPIARLAISNNIGMVWPKGTVPRFQTAFIQIMQTVAEWGKGPSKTAAFDDRLTAMRSRKKP